MPREVSSCGSTSICLHRMSSHLLASACLCGDLAQMPCPHAVTSAALLSYQRSRLTWACLQHLRWHEVDLFSSPSSRLAVPLHTLVGSQWEVTSWLE